jgi:hypothetical protein
VSAIKKILKPKTCKNVFLIQQWMKEFSASYSGMYTPTHIAEKRFAYSVCKSGCVFKHVIAKASAQNVEKHDMLKFNDG